MMRRSLGGAVSNNAETGHPARTSHYKKDEQGGVVETDQLEWLGRCARGEAAACAELVARYGRMVGTIILRTLGRPEDVEDLVQETFLRVFRYLPEFEGRAKLSTWICTVAQRVAVDELRRRQRAVATAPEELAAQVPADDDVLQATEQQQRDTLLRAAVAELPDKYRLPLVYASIDGLDYEAIATMLAVPVGTVKTNIFRGKQLLRERLAQLAPAGGAHAH
jgi:RNA polymerase sigma-70 factor (ECF subfamily)